MDLLSDLKKGKRGAIAKAITIVENDQKETKKLLKKIFKDSGNSSIIGITGPAGSGKSSLINKTVISLKKSGTAFMGTFNDIYYSFSPTIADMEREHPMFKEAVKLAITPMISSLSLMENAETESEVLSIGISVIMLNLGMYLGVPAIVIIGIRRKF